MSLIVKAYLEKPDKTEEIRRFALDPDVAASFAYLTKKLSQVFPTLGNDNYAVYWKDEEGDLIAVSSDDELTLALGCIKEEIFKIYLKEQTGAAKNDGQVHPGVVCDVCEENIKGIRYKCTTCLDYDLCGKCEGKGLHSEHEMMRIATPRQPFGQFRGAGPFGPCGPPPPPHQGPAPPPPYFGGMPHGPWMGPPFWFGGRCPKRNQKRHEKEKGSSVDSEKAGPSNEANQQQKQQAEGGPEGGSFDGSDFLKKIGESVAMMLDPLGIDVDIDVEHNGKREKAAGGKKSGEGKGDKSKESKNGKKQEKKAESPSKENAEQMDTSERSQNKQQSDDMNVSWEAQVARDVDLQDDKEKKQEKVPEKPAEPAAEQPDGEWTMINKSPSSESPISDAAEAQPSVPTPAPSAPAEIPAPPTGNIYPGLADCIVDCEPQHPDPKIANALRQMANMGFSNDGGWLTRLLEAKDGDIGQVLDAIHPNRRQ